MNTVSPLTALYVSCALLCFVVIFCCGCGSIEKLSVEYLSPWAEALHFAWSCGLVAGSGPLGRGVVDGLRRVLRGGDSSAAEGVFRAL